MGFLLTAVIPILFFLGLSISCSATSTANISKVSSRLYTFFFPPRLNSPDLIKIFSTFFTILSTFVSSSPQFTPYESRFDILANTPMSLILGLQSLIYSVCRSFLPILFRRQLLLPSPEMLLE